MTAIVASDESVMEPSSFVVLVLMIHPRVGTSRADWREQDSPARYPPEPSVLPNTHSIQSARDDPRSRYSDDPLGRANMRDHRPESWPDAACLSTTPKWPHRGRLHLSGRR